MDYNLGFALTFKCIYFYDSLKLDVGLKSNSKVILCIDREVKNVSKTKWGFEEISCWLTLGLV